MAMGKQAVTGREKPVEIRKTLKRVLSYLTEYKLQIVVVLICIVFSAVAGVFATALLQPLLDNLVEKGILVEEKMTTLITTVVTMACIYLVGAVSNFFVNRLMLNISTEALFKIRRDLFAHMEKLPIKFFDTNTHGNLMTRYTNDTDSLNDMIRQSIPQLISSALTLITVLVMMIRLSWILTLVIALMSVIMIVFLKVIGGKSQRNFITYQKSIGSVNGYMEEMMEGQRVVKVFNHEDKVMERFEVINDELCESATKANTYANILMPIMGNLTHMFYALIAIVGVVTALAFPEQNLISIGTLATFLLYVRSFAQPIQQSSQQLNMIFGAVAGAQRVFEVIDEPVEVDDGYVTLVNANISKDGVITESENQTEHWAWKHPHKADGTVTYTEVKGEVTFDNVVFGYEPNKIVLRGISLYALEGQKIAFVGSTGAGKTTITNLINRFYDVPDGKIRYDGININKIKKDDLRHSLAMVLQETHLFTGTVMDNIRYGKLTATDEECIAASKLANADFFISHLPEGYMTVLCSDGANLSQGQRQLISIARAAVADPPVLILDEATSSIDTRTEALIEKGMDGLMKGRTVFVIAHRLSTVRNSDAIMVLEKGEIIERGSHNELIAEKGKYYQLYTGAFELS